MTEKYDGKDDLYAHLAKWAQDYGTKPQSEWVHLFCHTLDVIPMNWYLETELCHGSVEPLYLDLALAFHAISLQSPRPPPES